MKLKIIKGDDYKYLWELRIKFSSNNFRVIYFLYIKNVFVLLHAFKKKTPKIQKKELDTAKNRMIDYLKRKGE
ncbi:MAG: type II toxin-antitoxin system RelE/ParE family toxin [Actinobacteria bacterium]|nr:type II toxin-antitoxin system RelE/ParE family toxin [Actinomycetota bacterium]MBU4483137.1 type II toxin-antitoxin system RelE/ParE family toxin [Actinomycetota bacterium]